MIEVIAALSTIGAAVALILYLRKFDTGKRLADKLATLLEADVDYPGHMAFANKGGEYFHGCRVARFRTISDLNHFFEPGSKGHLKLVGEIIAAPDGSFLCVYTAKLTNADLERVERWNREQHAAFAEERKAEEQEQREKEEARLRDEAETKRLAEVGRKYEARTAKLRVMAPGSDRKEAEKRLNAGELDE